MNCVFCEILYSHQTAPGTGPTKIVFDGVGVLGIVPLNPVVEGHVIFMPRKHVRDAVEDPLVTGYVTQATAEYIKQVQRHDPVGEPSAFNIITSIGKDATQSVFHLHVHVVPRQNGDGLHLPWTGQKINEPLGD